MALAEEAMTLAGERTTLAGEAMTLAAYTERQGFEFPAKLLAVRAPTGPAVSQDNLLR